MRWVTLTVSEGEKKIEINLAQAIALKWMGDATGIYMPSSTSAVGTTMPFAYVKETPAEIYRLADESAHHGNMPKGS